MSVTRRDFLQKMSAGAAGIGLVPRFLHTLPYGRSLDEVGVILGLVSAQMRQNYAATLTTIAETGYSYLEFGGYYGVERDEFLATMRDLDLRVVAGGGNIRRLQSELYELIEDSHISGREYIVCYWPWPGSAQDGTLDDIKVAIDVFNRMGEICRQEGLRFAFHNHAEEFREMDGVIPYDLILAETDPAAVWMQLDLYWITRGGADPIEYFRRYPGRFPLCHVKDMNDPVEQGFEIPGQGIIDFGAIFAHAETAGLEYYVVEQDNAPDPMRTLREAYTYIDDLRF